MKTILAGLFAGLILVLLLIATIQAQDPTTIEIRDEVRVPDVKRLGINIDSHSQWGAAQILKNLITNPGFEAGVYGMVAHAAADSTGTRFEQDFWDTSWNNDLYGIGQPEDFWNGAGYEIVYGPAKGRAGTVTDFAHENNHYTYYLDQGGTAPEMWDVMFMRQRLDGTLAGAPGRWDARSADPTQSRPGSPGRQSMHLTSPTESWMAPYEFFMDSLWRDGDRDAGKLLLVEGNWHLEFWAKGNIDGAQLGAQFLREGEADFIDETISLTTGWQKYEFDVFVPQGTDSPGPYGDGDYHPILGLLFRVPNSGDEAWVDDVALYRADYTNPTAFTDKFVDRLKELNPGILRDWRNMFGDTLDLQLAEPWARRTQGWRPHEREPGEYGYSLHEFLELCQEVGAEPWYVIAPTFSPEDLVNLVEYLAGPADGMHPYADQRAALGQSGPWTDVFPIIHLEFGNELWGGASGGDPFFGGSLLGGARLGAIAHDRFGILQSSPYYDAASSHDVAAASLTAKFNLIIGGQAGWAAQQTEIEGNSSNHDSIALAPYFGILDQWDNDATIYYPLFATPFDWANTGRMGQSNANIDSFGQGTELAIYEINFHTTSGAAPLDVRNDFVTGLDGGIALPLHMLVYMRDLGIVNQTAYTALGFATNFSTNPGEYVRLWGMLRDLEATGRKRPTWLGMELANKAIQGDMLTTVQGGPNPSWVQTAINGVETATEVSYVQSFAFRDGDSYSVILFNLSLDESQPVRLDLPAQPNSQATRYELTSASIHDDNEDADNVSIQTTQLTDFADQYELTLPPHSVNVITWNTRSALPTATATTPTPTNTSTPTATPTSTSTPTPTSTPDLSLTTIEIQDLASVSQVKPFGIVLGWRDRWGAGQIVKNIIENPGFEAGLFRSIIHANDGASGTRVPQAFWDTSWNDDQWGIGQPQGFWNGAEFEIIYGPAKGRTGTITNFTHENNQNVFYLDSDGVAPEQYDAIIVRTELPGVNAWGYAYSADTTTVRPGSPGSQSLRLGYPAEPWQEAYAFYMDASWRDGDPSSGKLMIVQGNWHLEFWAKGGADGGQLRVSFFREDEVDFINETITLTTGWQKIERDVFIPAGTDPVRAYTDEEYHPLLGFAFHIPTAGDEAWVDDVALYRSGDTNPTVFTDQLVDRLKELGPGVLRDWDDHQMGNSPDNELTVPWARKTVNYSPSERDPYLFPYSLHEFLELCQEIGAEPWHVVPPPSSPADLVNLLEYLAGPADGAHPYADRRAALGQSTPWTDVFPMIHLEFGNELWGTAQADDPFFGASLMNGVRLGQIAHDRFGILKSSPYYNPAKFNTIIGGQAGWTPRQPEIEGNSSNHDTISLAPYFQFNLDRYGSDEEVFYSVFAQPFDNVTSGIMRESKDYIDSFGQGTGLAVYELNFHTTFGDVPIDIRNDLVTGMGGIALPLHMLVYLRDMGITEQAAFGIHGYSTKWTMEISGYTRLWGMLRDLESTGRKRPTWLGVEIVNKAVQGDLLTTVQGGANPTWHQMPFNGVLNEIDVSYVQSFAFRDGDNYSVVLFNLSLDESQPVRLDLPTQPQTQATRYELTSASIHDDNEDAENVSIQTWQLTDFANGYELTLPPHSVNAITWNAAVCYDFDDSGRVDITDIMLVASRWRCECGDDCYDPLYDLDDNCDIDIVDIMLVAVRWGEIC